MSLPTPYYQSENVTLYCGDCLSILPHLSGVDAVVTDPPYPDWYVEEYKYFDGIIRPLESLPCIQYVFWSGRAEFPLTYTAVHVWNKNPSNCGAQYERIFERNGGTHQKVLTFYMLNSSVAAQMTGDELFGHPSQKPIKLITELCGSTNSTTILDPFMGSGTTGVAAVRLGRKFIGIEIDEGYCAIAARRIKEAEEVGQMFREAKPQQLELLTPNQPGVSGGGGA